MKPSAPAKLDSPDTHYLRGAVGWLELGNPGEAGEEIARISPALLDHPDVLEVRWSISAAGQRWDTALDIGERLVQTTPERSSGWVHRAYAMRRATGGGLEKAWAALRPAYEKFPKESVIPYNLACYAAQFGWLEEAWGWLHKSMEAEGNVQSVQKRALADSDLAALWERIRNL